MTSKFLKACKKGYLSSVKFLVKKGVDVNVQEGEGLLLACRKGHLYTAKFLYEKGAKTYGAFHNACASGNLNLVEFIYDEGYLKREPKIIDSDYPSGIIEACKHGHFDILEFLISNKVYKYENMGKFGFCLELACKNGNVKIVELLLQIHIFSSDSLERGLKYCILHGHVDVAKFLIGKGVYVYQNVDAFLINSVCRRGHSEMTKYLIENGSEDLYKGAETFIKGAISSANKELVKWLLKRYENVRKKNIVCWIYKKSRKNGFIHFLLRKGFTDFVGITEEELEKYKKLFRIRKVVKQACMKGCLEKFYDPDCVGGKSAKKEISNFLESL